MRHAVLVFLSTLAVRGLPLHAPGAEPVSTRTLLAELTDLTGLAEFPRPTFTCRQFSSYDRASTTPGNAETWFANGDAGKFLRVEERDGRQEHVLMDAAGPGAIVRIWSANPKGTLRVYLDGEERPALVAGLADLLSGKVPGIPEPLAHTASAGWNCYFPIPYAGHCKVTSDEGGFYYHVNYRTYRPETPVTTFAAGDLETAADEVARIARALASPRAAGQAAGDRPARLGLPETLPLAPGSVKAFTGKGPGMLTALQLRVEADDIEQALRQVVLRIRCDGQDTVACPLGDFFGTAPGLNPYESLPLGVTADGELWSHWRMPYEKTLTLGFENKGAAPVTLRVAAREQDYRWTERSLHFHAGWRVARDVPTRPFQDWNYATVEGRGVFVGAAFAIANPVKHWWGEGDEKIYVDGEAFPSHFGTGTEDYYGYAWCNPTPFTHAYHNQVRCDGPGNYGHTAVNRWHILDRIPFERDFRFDMELWHAAECRVPELSVATYWYARPGASSRHAELTADDLRLVKVPPYEPPRVAGAIEGEELRVVEHTGKVRPQEIAGCSNDWHLWWTDGKPGDRLVLALPVPEAGRYRVLVRLVQAGDYGVVRMSINGQPAGGSIDLYQDGLGLSAEIGLGEFELAAGENRLAVEIVGSNEKAAPGHMCGLDYVRLERMP